MTDTIDTLLLLLLLQAGLCAALVAALTKRKADNINVQIILYTTNSVVILIGWESCALRPLQRHDVLEEGCGGNGGLEAQEEHLLMDTIVQCRMASIASSITPSQWFRMSKGGKWGAAGRH